VRVSTYRSLDNRHILQRMAGDNTWKDSYKGRLGAMDRTERIDHHFIDRGFDITSTVFLLSGSCVSEPHSAGKRSALLSSNLSIEHTSFPFTLSCIVQRHYHLQGQFRHCSRLPSPPRAMLQ
jgi:hypothetical protein